MSIFSDLFHEQCIFFLVQSKFLLKHNQIQYSITKVCFYCTADTSFWGCTVETCQCRKTCHSGIAKVSLNVTYNAIIATHICYSYDRFILLFCWQDESLLDGKLKLQRVKAGSTIVTQGDQVRLCMSWDAMIKMPFDFVLITVCCQLK